MREFLVILFILSGASVFSQEKPNPQDTLAADTTKVEADTLRPQKQWGIFGEASLQYGPQTDGYGLDKLYGAGIAYQHFSAGFFFAHYHDKIASITNFFPRKHDLIYAYGGGFVGRRIIRTKLLQSDVRISTGRGDMIWEESDTKADFLRDEFNVIKPELQVAFVPAAFIRAYCGIGYRFISGLDLAGVSAGDFSGLSFNFGIRIGYFNEP